MVETGTWKPRSGLAEKGISTRSAGYNASDAVLREAALTRNEGRLAASGAQGRLADTGWSGGNARSGKRMPIRVTRLLLNAAMNGFLDRSDYVENPVWGLSVPTSWPEETIPFLNPEERRRNRGAFRETAGHLRGRILPRLAAQKTEGLMGNAKSLAAAVEQAENE